MSNQEIRDAVERVIAEMYVGTVVACMVRDAAKRLYPLSKPREVIVDGVAYRVTEPGHLEYRDNQRGWLVCVGNHTLQIYRQLYTLGFTEEE